MNRIKHLRKVLGLTQDKFSKQVHVGRSTVAMWETSSQDPDYSTLKTISQIFNVPPNYVLGDGIFENWDTILEYYGPLMFHVEQMIPPTLVMPSFCDEKTLVAWLDTRLYFEPDELAVARWFDFAVEMISFTTGTNDYGDKIVEDLDIVFTQAFNAICDAERARRSGEYPSSNLTRVERDTLAAVRRYKSDPYFPELIALYGEASDRDRALIRQILSEYQEKNSPALPVDTGESVG